MLLSKVEWDKEQLIRDLREEWGIVDEEPDEGDEDVENLSLIHIFNKMGFIETEKRDEIYMALRGILDALPDGTLQKDCLLYTSRCV